MKTLYSNTLLPLFLTAILCQGVVGCGDDCPTDSAPVENNDTTDNGSPAPVEVEHTLAVRFTGSDHVRIPGSSDLQLNELGEFSVDAWVQADGWGLYSWILSQAPSNNNVDLLLGFVNGKSRMIFNGIGNDMTSPTTMTKDTWHHVVALFDGDSISLYVDGEVEATQKVNPADSMGVADLIIGAREGSTPGSTTESFQGVIYELRIWNQALSPEQIDSAAYTRVPDLNDKSGIWGSDEGLKLLARWSLSNGSGPEVPDLTGNGHDGVLSGSTWVAKKNPFYSGM